MVKSFFFVVCAFFSAVAIGVNAAPLQGEDDAAQQCLVPDVVRNFDWDKKFDASVETDPNRRMLARQYAALRPMTDKMRELFIHERVSAISIYHLRVRQLELRWQLEQNPQEKKKCLEVLVHHLKQIQESYLLLMERPAGPVHSGGDQLGQTAVDNIVDSTLKIVKWEMQLELLNEKMPPKKKQ